MLKPLLVIFGLLALALPAFAQDDLNKLVAAEHAFAEMAAKEGTRAAFLANLTDDAVVFGPDKTNAKQSWTARAAGGTGLLAWAPNYADISANGVMGYTTGNWQFHPQGKTSQPTAFGDFVTIWLRQPDGRYKWVVDIGVGHAKPERYSTEWTTSPVKTRDANEKGSSAADAANGFFEMITRSGVKKAYQSYASDDIRMYREDKMPILGRKAALDQIASEKTVLTMAKKSSFFGSADLAYDLSTYTRSQGDKIVERGNYMQVWKLVGGKWRIVLEIFKPVPEQK